jgi:hypothetical protein
VNTHTTDIHRDRCCDTCGIALDDLNQDDWGVIVDQRDIGDLHLDVPVQHVFCTQVCFDEWMIDQSGLDDGDAA